MLSHPSRVRGLKLRSAARLPFRLPSHPSRVRGLKSLDPLHSSLTDASHPSRVRGLKSNIGDVNVLYGDSRTLHGCVD